MFHPRLVHRLSTNDVLFTNTSSTLWVGKTALVRDPGDWGFSNHMTRLRVPQGMSPEFVARQLHYLCISGYFAFHCKKHINQSSISGKQLFEEVPFRLAPAREQKLIANKLRRLLGRERALQHNLEALHALIQRCQAAVLESACAGRLVPTEAMLARKEHRQYEPASGLLDRILKDRRATWEANQLAKMTATGKAPKDDKWKGGYESPKTPAFPPNSRIPDTSAWVALDQLLYEIEAGKSYQCLSRPAAEGEWGIIKVSAMSWGEFDESENKALPPGRTFDTYNEIHPGDILLSRSNTPALVGASVLVRKTRRKLLLSDKSMRLLPSPLIDRAWLHLAISSKAVRRQLSELASGASGSMLNVSQNKVRQIAFALPPLAEQKRIVAEVDRRRIALSRMEAQVTATLQEASQLRVSMLHRAFSGKLVSQPHRLESGSLLLKRIAAAKNAFETDQKMKARKRMKKPKPAEATQFIENLLASIKSHFPDKPFTFQHLQNHLPADYESLKIQVFKLLAARKGMRLRQVFNRSTKRIDLQRVPS